MLAAVAVVAAVLVLNKSSYAVPYPELKKAGYTGSAEALLASLANDESSKKERTAYELALENGYKGSRRDFVFTLLNSRDCSFNAEDKDSYDIALEYGITCTEKQWKKTFDAINEPDLKNSYYLALENGFTGTASDWLDCAKGKIGGKSAYSIARKNGYKGSEAEWLADLADNIGAYGKEGKTLYELAVYLGFDGSFAEWLSTLYNAEDASESNRAEYNNAVKNGYKGSFEEWLSYLVSSDNGGLSPYEIVRNDGYSQSVGVWLDSLVSSYDEKGSAYDEAAFNSYARKEKDWNAVISAKNYEQSPYDIAVKNGYNGSEAELKNDVANIYNEKADAVSTNAAEIIKKASVDKNGNLTAELADGEKIDLGKLDVGEDDEKKSSKLSIYADKVTAARGSTITVPVIINNNSGILGAALTVEYDSSVMTLTSAQNGSAFSGVLTLTKSKTLDSGCRFLWDGIELEKGQIKDGDILLLTFDIADNAEAGEYEIGISCDKGSFIKSDLKSVTPETKSGSITIVK